MLKIFVGIFVAVLAVIGFYSVLRCLAERWLSSGCVVLSILVRGEEDIVCLEATVVEHIYGALGTRSQRLAMLLAEEVADDPRVLEVARKYGADKYIVSRID